MRCALLTLSLVALSNCGTADAAAALRCPRPGKPRTLDFTKGSDDPAVSVGPYGGKKQGTMAKDICAVCLPGTPIDERATQD